MKRLNQDHIIGLACIILSMTIFGITRTFPKASTGANELTGPSFYPNLLAILFFICGICEIVYGLKEVEERSPIEMSRFVMGLKTPASLNILIIIGLTVFFILFLEALGFVVCSAVFLFILMWRFGVSLLKNLLYSVLYLLFLFLVFGKIFAIYLPSGILDFLGI